MTQFATEKPGTDYNLKIDEQAEHFLAAKQQLTYFIVAAAVAPIGFVSAFLREKGTEVEAWGLAFLLTGSLFGLLGAGAALLSIRLEHESQRRHINLRYDRKLFDDLCQAQQLDWTRLNERAKRLFSAALFFVVAEMPLMAGFLTLFVLGVAKQ